MCDLVARTGRHQQRYEDGCRLIAGCIPFKYRDSDGKKIVEVLMINSQSGPGLLFPKGGWENDENVEEAAVREAVEEAGVRGKIMIEISTWHHLLIKLLFTYKTYDADKTRQSIFYLSRWIQEGDISNVVVMFCGCCLLKGFIGYYFFKSKTLRDEFCPEGQCKAAMFALLVNEELHSWPEDSTRRRSWLAFHEAAGQCRHAWMHDALVHGFSRWLADNTATNSSEDPDSA